MLTTLKDITRSFTNVPLSKQKELLTGMAEIGNTCQGLMCLNMWSPVGNTGLGGCGV